jgi:hypothetical protein
MMDPRPHSNSTYRSKLVTKGEQHRRRSRLIQAGRIAKARANQTQKMTEINTHVSAIVSIFVVLLFVAIFFLR